MKIIETTVVKKNSSIIYPGIILREKGDAHLKKAFLIIGMSRDSYALLKSFDKNIFSGYYDYPNDVLIINIHDQDTYYEHILDCSLLHFISFDKMGSLILNNSLNMVGEIPYSDVVKIKRVLNTSDHIAQNVKDEYLI